MGVWGGIGFYPWCIIRGTAAHGIYVPSTTGTMGSVYYSFLI